MQVCLLLGIEGQGLSAAGQQAWCRGKDPAHTAGKLMYASEWEQTTRSVCSAAPHSPSLSKEGLHALSHLHTRKMRLRKVMGTGQ